MLLRFRRCSPEEVLGRLADVFLMLLTSQMFPRFPLDASQMPPGCNPNASLMFLGCLLPDASNLNVSPQMPHPGCVPPMPPCRCLFPDTIPQMFPEASQLPRMDSKCAQISWDPRNGNVRPRICSLSAFPTQRKGMFCGSPLLPSPPSGLFCIHYSGAFLYSLHERE